MACDDPTNVVGRSDLGKASQTIELRNTADVGASLARTSPRRARAGLTDVTYGTEAHGFGTWPPASSETSPKGNSRQPPPLMTMTRPCIESRIALLQSSGPRM